MRKTTLTAVVVTAVLCTVVPNVAFGQTATIVYADDVTEVELLYLVGRVDDLPEPDIGVLVPPDATIRTGNTGVELLLEPSGSIVRIAEDTTFTVESMQEADDHVEHRFRLDTGKVRTVVSSVRSDRFFVRTPLAVAGVRGTDFVQRVIPGQTDWICVREGEVNYTRQSDASSVVVSGGTFADATHDTLVAAPIGPEELEELFADVQFTVLDPEEV